MELNNIILIPEIEWNWATKLIDLKGAFPEALSAATPTTNPLD